MCGLGVTLLSITAFTQRIDVLAYFSIETGYKRTLFGGRFLILGSGVTWVLHVSLVVDLYCIAYALVYAGTRVPT
jgi:hypothetical protein